MSKTTITKTHICTESPCPIEDRELIERFMNSSGTIYTKTSLEQFNEEVKKELTEIFERTFFAIGSCATYGNSKPDSAFIDFITQKLTEHKALILKMVREKVPNQFLCLDTDREIGWNDCRQEFLNNLDTI